MMLPLRLLSHEARMTLIHWSLMKPLIAMIAILMCTATTVEAQAKKKKAPVRSRTSNNQPDPTTLTKPRIIGSNVIIITKNGERITGEVLDLTAYSVKIKTDNLESTIALDTIASLSFNGAAAPSTRTEQTSTPVRPDFARDAETALGFFQTLSANLKPGLDYTEYGRQLLELRRAGERFITRYSSTDNPAEARAVSLIAGALNDYSWARAIWTLKFGKSSDGTIAEADSPVIADAVALYPDLRETAATGNKLSVDKLVAGIWRKALEKQARARSLITTR
jgi:hypothetical protein